jgi:hypothetical protein
MTIRGWRTKYDEIRSIFGYKESDDIDSAKKLNSIIEKKFPSSNFKKKIFGKTVFVIGAGPSLDSAITVMKKYENVTKIVADGAIEALIKHKIRPDILVTDLDGDIKSIKKIARTNTPIIVHAHGDNKEQLDMVKKFKNKLGTTQSIKFGRLENFGGFTDGDRCVFLAENFKPEKIILFGMDFGNTIGKYSKHVIKDRSLKLKKLAWGEKLLEWLATKSNSDLYTTSKPIKGFKKINLIDLDYIINT